MEVRDYIVTLGIRPAELSGLKELPGTTKDALTPLVMLAPWLATTPLSRALDKFEEAYPARPYFLDVDTYYRINDNVNEAKEAWSLLAKKPADLASWWALLEKYPNAQPCLLMAEHGIDAVRSQIEWARDRGRSFCIRLNFDEASGAGIPPWLPILTKELADEGANDYAVVFEFGWLQDALIAGPLVHGIYKSFLSEVPPEVPICVSCTTFPRDFTPYDGKVPCAFNNRKLVEQLRKQTNHPRIIYGDWGTTRPRSYEIASTPKNRIDYPTDDSWIIARDQGGKVSFQVAAKRITEDKAWAGNLGVWGEQLIEGARKGEAFAIDTMQKMYAARINIHLHRQAFFGHLPPPQSLDEEWTDDL